MHFERDTRGDWVIDPEQLASKLGINAAHLRHEMRLGLVTSRIEAGQGTDEGYWRVTINAAHLRHEMRLGLVTSRIEAGQGTDEGYWRVTIRTRKAAWQGIIDDAGCLVSERCP
ncbi:hypothetical protein ASF56_24355 [Methylobacterium sp. Leaf122]|nr:hypothetical protein ASF56_24355 [Methylobacterium sp. Leaf122]